MDILIAVAVFIVALTLFYYFYGLRTTSTELKEEAERIADDFRVNEFLKDGELTQAEIDELLAMDCTQIKAEFSDTTKSICLYAVDSEGNLVAFDTGATLYSVGCPGLTVNGADCGTPSP